MKLTEDKYQPIDCNFHDILLDRATRKIKVNLKYLLDNQPIEKQVIFKDVNTKSKEEFLVLEDGETIRLDKIISVDQIILPKTNSCQFK